MVAPSSYNNENNTQQRQAVPPQDSPRTRPRRTVSTRSTGAGRREAPERPGKKLRKARIKMGLQLADIQQKTRISRRTLIAMEANCYDDMPAFSFCRGFYKMYAEAVGLNAEDIVFQFEQEYNRLKRDEERLSLEFGDDGKDVDSIAGRPSLLAYSSIGFILLLLLFFAGFLCWFFSWNPASFLSQQLRNLSPESQYEIPLDTAEVHSHSFSQQQALAKQTDPLYIS